MNLLKIQHLFRGGEGLIVYQRTSEATLLPPTNNCDSYSNYLAICCVFLSFQMNQLSASGAALTFCSPMKTRFFSCRWPCAIQSVLLCRTCSFFFLSDRYDAEIPVDGYAVAGMDDGCCIRYAGNTGEAVFPRNDRAVDQHAAPSFNNC